MSPSKRWNDSSVAQRTAIVVAATAEIGLTVAAAVDLRRRPQDHVRGRKLLWWLGIFVQPVGPIAYLGWARRTQPDTSS